MVRLKGGDPFVFGRGGEEAAALAEAGIPFEIVPGVTAALAAAAYAGIPLTHRVHSSAVVFLTGHEDPSKPDATVRWEDYSRLGATLCIYMGMRNLATITRRLQAGGMAPATAGGHRAGRHDRTASAAARRPSRRWPPGRGPKRSRHRPSSSSARRGLRQELAWFQAVAGGRSDAMTLRPHRQRFARARRASQSARGRRGARGTRRCAGRGRLLEAQRPHSGGGTRRRAPAWTLGPWIAGPGRGPGRAGIPVRAVLHQRPGRDRIGSARRSCEASPRRRQALPVSTPFTAGLAAADLAVLIVADRVRETIAAQGLRLPPVIVVDHGGPSPASAALRNAVAARSPPAELGAAIGPLAAASLESPDGPDFAFNQPLFGRTARRRRVRPRRRGDRSAFSFARPPRRPGGRSRSNRARSRAAAVIRRPALPFHRAGRRSIPRRRQFRP